MKKPVVAQTSPFAVDVVAGHKYAWCACGLSKKQPFCDGQHKGTDIKPLVFMAETTKTVFFHYFNFRKLICIGLIFALLNLWSSLLSYMFFQ